MFARIESVSAHWCSTSRRASRHSIRAFVASWLFVALVTGCAEQHADGIKETASIVSLSRPGTSYARESGYLTPPATGVQLWYERVGNLSRPVIVLLNGSDSQAIYWPSTFIVDLLDAGYAVIRYDPRDTGLSQWLPFPEHFDPERWTPEQPPPYGLDVDVEDLFGLMDGLDVPHAHLVGVSQGGMIAQLAAISDPERVLSLTLLSTTPSNPYDARLGVVDPELLAYLIEQFPRVGRTALLPAFLVRNRVIDLQTDLLARVAGVNESQRAVLRDYVAASYDRAGLNGASSQGFAVASATSRLDRLAAITMPTLIIHGTQDRMIQPRHAVALAEAVRDARLIWVEGGGHGFPFEMYTAHVDAMFENFGRHRPKAKGINSR